MYLGKAVIGVMPLYDEEKDSLWMLPGYLEGLQARGAIPLILPLTENRTELDYFAASCDGFLLTGGQDVDPALYGEEKLAACRPPCAVRDAMESYLLPRLIRRDKAVLGICRGLQVMNAVCGGSLWQDLPGLRPSEVCHAMQPPYDAAAHTVEVLPDTPLAGLLGTGPLGVNSCHHQGILRLADCLAPMAVAPDGLIEAVYHPDRHFVWGVQWHPEFSFRCDDAAARIFAAFVSAARDK